MASTVEDENSMHNSTDSDDGHWSQVSTDDLVMHEQQASYVANYSCDDDESNIIPIGTENTDDDSNAGACGGGDGPIAHSNVEVRSDLINAYDANTKMLDI